uniref:Uncharacterized protein n=1 Tax=Ananas comosus var. bracteatus TaxID=296719 RepID=A0A6V7NJ98_ANACO|nr:unnamed protein product [Ananas comosus var. bracteatus]
MLENLKITLFHGLKLETCVGVGHLVVEQFELLTFERGSSLPMSGVALYLRAGVGAKSGVAHALRHLSYELGEERGSSLPIVLELWDGLDLVGRSAESAAEPTGNYIFYSSHPVWFWGTGTHVSGPAGDRGKGIAP